ncbi:MAG: cheV [Firmicutes bacterium]|nr:cheV [Bacillota bacterium]
MQDNRGILLETGTNEFEIIEFSVGGVYYGINVAKVREVINLLPITPLVNAHPYIEGMFTLRGNVIPMVNLAKALSTTSNSDSHKIIVCEINAVHIAFKVDDVYRIHRISWKQMEPVPHLSGSDRAVGIVKMEQHLIILLDFEKILAEINPELNEKMTAIPESTPDLIKERQYKTLLIAEDSHMLRELLVQTLHTSGYRTISTENGEEAWNKLESLLANEGPIEKYIQMVITDIEMPRMDGHHLTKRIKEEPNLKELPVVIFSSLINEEMRRKGEALGAHAQITKPEIEQLIGILDRKLLV